MSTQRPPEEPSERVKKDIEEILRRMSDDAEAEEREPIRVAAPRKPRIVKPAGRRSAQPGILMAIGALLLVLALVVPPLRLALAVGGFALLGSGYYMSWRGSRSGTSTATRGRSKDDEVRYWRGQRIEYDGEQPRRDNVVEFRETWGSKVRRWAGRRRR